MLIQSSSFQYFQQIEKNHTLSMRRKFWEKKHHFFQLVPIGQNMLNGNFNLNIWFGLEKIYAIFSYGCFWRSRFQLKNIEKPIFFCTNKSIAPTTKRTAFDRHG